MEEEKMLDFSIIVKEIGNGYLLTLSNEYSKTRKEIFRDSQSKVAKQVEDFVKEMVVKT